MTAFLERFKFQEEYLTARPRKAEKIMAALKNHGMDLPSAKLLDVGCSQGIITELLSQKCAWIVGVDFETLPVRTGARNIAFVQADACHLPLQSSLFDGIILNHVLEHVEDPVQLLREVWRVLVPGGLCYLACPNRFSLIEPHYRLPLLSWLPRRMADSYVRLCQRGDKYLDRPPHYAQLLKIIQPFESIDLSVPMIKNPSRYYPGDRQLIRQTSWARWIPGSILNRLKPMFPVFVCLLRKPPATRE
jgi:ubiquinone/menaquinone biosynthesis C-methylase UbiE